MIAAEVFAIAVFAGIHLFAGKLRFLDGIPRSRWLSLAGGISVAYVFVHLFPELAMVQKELAEHSSDSMGWIEHHAYLLALLGLVLFYGLERMAKTSQPAAAGKGQPASSIGLSAERDGGTSTPISVFWIHIISFALYNGLVGYLLVIREDQSFRSLAFFVFAIGVHFLVNDYGLRQHHKETYRRKGRWILALALVAGWLLGLATEVSEGIIGVLFAFLAGGIILNVLKEELPEERKSRFLPFATGAAGYAVLLLL